MPFYNAQEVVKVSEDDILICHYLILFVPNAFNCCFVAEQCIHVHAVDGACTKLPLGNGLQVG